MAQTPLPNDLELGEEADDGKRRVYLVTFPPVRASRASTGEILVAPGSKKKAAILKCFLDSCANPVYHHNRNESFHVHVLETGIWRERCKDGSIHDHVPVVAKSFRFLPVKRALLQRHGLASHWSCTHTGYWSAVRYCDMASPKKPKTCLDPSPVLWASDGEHTPLDDCHKPPVTAEAMTAHRRKLMEQAAEAGKGDPKITEMDVWALVVRSKVRNTHDDRNAAKYLAAYAKQHCGEAMVQHLFRRRYQLNNLIDDIWEWEELDSIVAECRQTRVESVQAALDIPCDCRGAWLTNVIASFIANKIDIADLCHDIYDALQRGRSETTPVIVLAGNVGGEGKSMFLKPLFKIFSSKGSVFTSPKRGGFPLLGLPEAKVAFLDEYRFDPNVIDYATMCSWFDGSAVTISRPQNVSGATGHDLYRGSAPIFLTTKLSDLQWLEERGCIDPATGGPYDAEASMVYRRLKVHRFMTRMPKPRQFSFCGHCFAQLVTSQSRVWSERHALAT